MAQLKLQYRSPYVNIEMLLTDNSDRGGVNLTTFISVIVALSAIGVTLSVMVQESNQAGLGTLDGSASASAEWGANRGTSRKEMLKRITLITSIVFFISTIILVAITQ